jgi:hypothetical protein
MISNFMIANKTSVPGLIFFLADETGNSHGPKMVCGPDFANYWAKHFLTIG